MSLLQRLQENITKKNLFAPGEGLLLAISGGVDSVVLCHLLAEAKYNIILAHANFQLRGEESERDHEFVALLARELDLPLLTRKFDTASYANENRLSIQVAARELRYNWFREILSGQSDHQLPFLPKKIVTAHHADDNVETLLMNFFRGSGIHGLHGIPEESRKIIRPLLEFSRQDILDYARQSNIHWVDDSSNLTEKYTRNFLRHKVIPLLSEQFPELRKNLLGNIQRLGEVEVLYDEAVAAQKKKLMEPKGSEIHIAVLKLSKQKAAGTLLFEMCREFGFGAGQLPDLIGLLKAETGRFVQSATHRIIRNRKWLIITPLAVESSQFYVIEEADSTCYFSAGRLLINSINPELVSLDKNSMVCYVDNKQVHFPLLLRRWKPGDYFYPLGMKHKKKLARFFIDNKLSLVDKENTWVIESNKRIVWIVGRRIDDRFKITANTRTALKIEWQPDYIPR